MDDSWVNSPFWMGVANLVIHIVLSIIASKGLVNTFRHSRKINMGPLHPTRQATYRFFYVMSFIPVVNLIMVLVSVVMWFIVWWEDFGDTWRAFGE